MKINFRSLWVPYFLIFFLCGSLFAYIITEPTEAHKGDGAELQVEPPMNPEPVTIEEALELDPQ